MEEQALYRAILSAPHDDTARLVYADWLDENAERFPDPLARTERARAEFIRVQCALARLGPGGWKTGGPSDPELAKRQKRLILQHGKKWRRAFSPSLASSPFDRGFLRPFRALTPQDLLAFASLDSPTSLRLPPLSPESSARRYIPTASGFDACPLWDVHLYATDYGNNDERNDHGQYGDLLAEVGRSPALERVGWLKVSFFITPVIEFLRTGNFANVETLVLNSRPFPRVLEAVAENESFRSLRYVLFGGDWWAWSGTGPMSDRDIALLSKITDANQRHLPHGEMRTALRGILDSLPSQQPPVIHRIPAPSAPPPPSRPLRRSEWVIRPAPAKRQLPEEGSILSGALAILGLILIGVVCAGLIGNGERRAEPAPVEFNYDPDRYKVPPYPNEIDKWRAPIKDVVPETPPPRETPFLGPPKGKE